MRLRKKTVIAAAAGAALLLVGGGRVALQASLGSNKEATPTVRVKRGDIEMKVFTRGELRSAQAQMLVAPRMGGQLQLVNLLKTGTRVKKGDVVAEFDPSEQEYNLEQARYDLLIAEQEIIKSRADAAVRAANEEVELLRARFDVRRAELEASRNELLSAIDARKNVLSLEEARRRLKQLEEDVKSRAVSDRAVLAVLEARRSKARIEMEQAQQNIDSMILRAPMDGLVSVKEAQVNFFFTGMIVPELRAGDVVWPGKTIAEILEVEQMEILAKVSESDRGNINPGQNVEVRVDALPGRLFTGRVKNVAGMAARGGWWGTSSAERKFDATFALNGNGLELRPGVTAEVIIVGEQVRNALYLPRQAFFEKDGRPVVYVRQGETFEPREVRILKRTESQIALEGLKEGDEVALVNPEQRRRGPAKAAGPVTPKAGG